MGSDVVIILAGNPGSGKSTLLNSLAGRIIFQSGVSFGEGMTTVVQTARGRDGIIYGDTPGLDDIARRAKAADEIKKILRANNAIKLCIVITLEAGRIKPADKATMEVILDALPASTTNMFSIIINKVDKSVAEQFKNSENLERLLLGLNSAKHRTSHIHFVLKEDIHDGEDDAMLSNIESLRNTLDAMPILRYISSEVKDIKHDAFEKNREQFAADLEQVKKANKEQLNEMARRHDEALASARVETEKERHRFLQQMNQMNAEHQLALAALNERWAAVNRAPAFEGMLARISF